jgi:glyoxylase-like metal-dependent hydrolase (beta-lactamase superfamily II)
VDVQELAGGLWRWTGFHSEWKQVVGSVYFEAPDAIVLIDPLVPPEDQEKFWKALDRDVKRVGKPVHVLITVFWHTRDTREVAARYGASVWAPSRGRPAIERRAGSVTEVFRPGDALPGGVVPLATARAAEVVFWIPEHRTVVPGDVILGAEGGGLRLCPPSWLPEGVGHAKLRESLKPLLDLPAERVLVSHGEPVLKRGRAALKRMLES